MQLQKSARNWILRHDLPSAVNPETSVDLTLQFAATQNIPRGTKLFFETLTKRSELYFFLTSRNANGNSENQSKKDSRNRTRGLLATRDISARPPDQTRQNLQPTTSSARLPSLLPLFFCVLPIARRVLCISSRGVPFIALLFARINILNPQK